MSQVEGRKKPSKKIDWYKWIAGICVPLVVAVIGLLKFSGGGGEKQTAGNLTIITDVTVIENQYQQITGQPLKDENLKQLITSAVNLAKAGQNEASRKVFEQVANSVPVPAVYNNIGTLDAEAGNLPGSQQAFQQALAKDPNYRPAQRNLEKVGRLLQQGHDFEHAKPMQLGAKTAGAIADSRVTDMYQLTTPQGPRDIYLVSLENNSTGLVPVLTAFDSNRHQVGSSNVYLREALAHIECSFPAEGNATYYVRVSTLNDPGAYTLLVGAGKRYDSYEPNEDFQQAKSVSVGAAIEANIMDASDKDFYVIKSGTGGPVTARLENASTSLIPLIAIFDGNRHQVCGTNQYLREPLAHVECEFPAEANANYYVEIIGLGDTSGAYKLMVK